MNKPQRQARKLARQAAKLGRGSAKLDRRQEARLHEVARHLEETRLLSLGPDSLADPNAAQSPLTSTWPERRALLIINSKSGPRHDSIMRVGDLVDLLAQYNFKVDVRIKLSKAQARREARLAVDRGYPIVIAAGGDGTVEAVASGLVGTRTVLGIVPLGTFNNVATSLGVPANLAEACALIANFDARPIDVGQVEAVGMDKPRIFVEIATVGLGALLAPIGQDIEKGRLGEAARTLPLVMNMSPSGVLIRLDGEEPPIWGNAVLLTISNTPRTAAALTLAPAARVDDGLLDVVLYDGLGQGDLAALILDLKRGAHINDPRVRHARATSIEIHTNEPMAVAADSRLVGVTPARITVRSGALQVIVGAGPGLSRPATGLIPLQTLTSPDSQAATASALPEPVRTLLAPRTNGHQALELARLATPIVAALAGAAAVPLARALARRFEHRR